MSPRPPRAGHRGGRGLSPDRGQLAELGRRIDAGRLRPVVGGVWPLAEGRQAFQAYWFDPASDVERSWRWWDSGVVDHDHFWIDVDVLEDSAALGTFQWLLRAAGATKIDRTGLPGLAVGPVRWSAISSAEGALGELPQPPNVGAGRRLPVAALVPTAGQRGTAAASRQSPSGWAFLIDRTGSSLPCERGPGAGPATEEVAREPC